MSLTQAQIEEGISWCRILEHRHHWPPSRSVVLAVCGRYRAAVAERNGPSESQILEALKADENPWAPDDAPRLLYFLEIQSGIREDPLGRDAGAAWESIVWKPGADFGADVRIEWGGDLEGMCDQGYLTTIPPHTESDMGGIVHIPHPANPGGKGAPPAEWHTLFELAVNENVRAVVVGEDTDVKDIGT
jgi:hypothetical protein